MIVKPLQRYVLLKVTEFNDSKFNIVLPEHLRKKIPRGTVVDKGSYVEDIEIGQTVVFDKSGSKALPQDYVLCPDYRIHLTIEACI